MSIPSELRNPYVPHREENGHHMPSLSDEVFIRELLEVRREARRMKRGNGAR